tara:strand:- start:5258 stop:6991 length:1734 start_codon:yes stop_codon:yes gene_type:complete
MSNWKYIEADPEGSTRLINNMGKETNPVQALREAIFNGWEAIARDGMNPDAQLIICAKNTSDFKDKLSVINVCGDYLSPRTARESLAKIGKSAHDNSLNDFLGTPYNFGVGLRISYLPHNCEGIWIISKSASGEKNMFWLKLESETKLFGFSPLEDDEGPTSFVTDFIEKDWLHPKLQGKNYGTEVIFMGNSLEESTWNTFSTQASSVKGEERVCTSNIPLHSWLSKRCWEPAGIVTTVTNQGSLLYLKGEMEACKIGGIKELRVEPYGLIKCYYCQPSSKEINKSKGLRDGNSFVTFAHRKETLYNSKEHYISNFHNMKACGIFANWKKWVIVFELDEELDVSLSPDRSEMTNIEPNIIYDVFRNNLPSEIQEDLRSSIGNVDSDKEIDKLLKALMKKLSAKKNKYVDLKGNLEIEVTDGSGSKNEKSKSILNKKGKSPSPRMTARRKLATGAPPAWTPVKTEDPPFVCCFDISPDYHIYIYVKHPVFQHMMEHMSEKYPSVPQDVIERNIIWLWLKGIVYRILKVRDNNPDMIMEKMEDLWSPNILEATWNQLTDKDLELTLAKEETKYVILAAK